MDIADDIEYEWHACGMIPESVYHECSTLFSGHYGHYAKTDAHGEMKRVRLSADKIRDYVESPDYNMNPTGIYMARANGRLVGYAIAGLFNEKCYGVIAWVTQLVVHRDYRHRGVAKQLLFSIWGFTSHFAWGLVSANPYAVRALEKATRRRCDPARIMKSRRKLMNLGRKRIHYIARDTECRIEKGHSMINTDFHLDLSSLPQMMENATSEDIPWTMGTLEEGWEWFAFTFHDQEQMPLSKNEIESMLKASDKITRMAYSRMALDSAHKWATHTDHEANHIIEACRLSKGQRVLDIGCGMGRHSNALASRGLSVSGVDYLDAYIQMAREESRRNTHSNVEFICRDCREGDFGIDYDAVICLYDVIGSYADDRENEKILHQIAKSLKTGGYALISVMNYELTSMNAKHVFTLEKEPNKLLTLNPSNTMEATGNIFDPDFYLVDVDTQVVYRKEQFVTGNALPVELIVRDRRYKRDEISMLCQNAGLKVISATFVQAGHWDNPLTATDSSSKEILVLCQKEKSDPRMHAMQ